jgi:hypothetical protein
MSGRQIKIYYKGAKFEITALANIQDKDAYHGRYNGSPT